MRSRACMIACACALALSACGPAATLVHSPSDELALAAGATLRYAPDDYNRLGGDISLRAVDAADSLSLVAHANLLFNVVGSVYALAGTGWGLGGWIDRSWEAGLGAQFDVGQSPTGPIALFVELGATYLESPPPEDPLGPVTSVSGGFLRVGLAWCFTIRIEC